MTVTAVPPMTDTDFKSNVDVETAFDESPEIVRSIPASGKPPASTTSKRYVRELPVAPPDR